MEELNPIPILAVESDAQPRRPARWKVVTAVVVLLGTAAVFVAVFACTYASPQPPLTILERVLF